MTGLLIEFRNAWRALMRSPFYALVTTLMLGTGLGLTMYMFGAINAFMLRPLPFDQPDSIAHIELADPATGRDSIEMPVAELLDLRPVQQSFESLAIYTTGTLNLSGDDRPERYEGGFMGLGSFDVLRVKPALGRNFGSADYAQDAAAVAIIGHSLWQQRFAGAPDVIGRPVRLNGKPATIIGVMPEGFRFPERQDVWTPFAFDPAKQARNLAPTGEVIGRLREGASFGSAKAEIDGHLAAIAQAHPETFSKGMRSVVKTLGEEVIGRNTARVLMAMMLAVLFVLLIACTNVGNLMAARSAERAREFAIHAALGAERSRLLWRLLLEGFIIATIAGAIGLVLAQWGGAATMRVLAEGDNGPPSWFRIELDWRTVSFAVVVAFGAALVANLGPALRASRRALTAGMREGGHGSSRARSRLSRAMVSGQIALCAVLLVAAGLTVRSIHAMQALDIGADVDGVMSGRVVLFEEQYPDEAQVLAKFEDLERGLQAIPGVSSAALTTSIPVSFAPGVNYAEPGSAPPAPDQRLPFAFLVTTTPSYFETFRIVPLRGRLYDQRDRADAPPVALINRQFAERLWPGQDPVGKLLDLDPQKTGDAPVQIIGLVPTVIQTEPDDNDFRDVLYVPMAQRPARYVSMALRTGGDPATLVAPMRAAVQAIDADLPIYFVRTVPEWIHLATISDQLLADLFTIFAFFGVLLAGAGIYALLAQGVTARTREIGVRRALGAEDRGIVRMVMRQGVAQLVTGLVVGLVLSVGFAQILANVLFGVGTFDVLTFAVTIATLASVVLVASFAPTRRALRVAPMQALRYD